MQEGGEHREQKQKRKSCGWNDIKKEEENEKMKNRKLKSFSRGAVLRINPDRPKAFFLLFYVFGFWLTS